MKLILSIWMLVLVSCVAADGLTPAQHQYNALHNEIIDFRDSPDCKVLTQAAYAVDPITNPLKYALTTGEKAIAKGLVSEYKEAKPDGFMIGTRFDNLFKKHITDPCSKIMELSKRLETLVNANAELEDFRGYPQAPFGFTEQICSHLNEKKYKRTFEEFKKQLKQ